MVVFFFSVLQNSAAVPWKVPLCSVLLSLLGGWDLPWKRLFVALEVAGMALLSLEVVCHRKTEQEASRLWFQGIAMTVMNL